jgi:hypothetical protein
MRTAASTGTSLVSGPQTSTLFAEPRRALPRKVLVTTALEVESARILAAIAGVLWLRGRDV